MHAVVHRNQNSRRKLVYRVSGPPYLVPDMHLSVSFAIRRRKYVASSECFFSVTPTWKGATVLRYSTREAHKTQVQVLYSSCGHSVVTIAIVQ